MFESKYHMSKEENILFAKRNVVDSVWKQTNLEGFNVTFPDTQAIYEQMQVHNAPVDEVLCIINLKHAWQYLLAHIDVPLDLDYLQALHVRIGNGLALAWGELRTGDVGISGTNYHPPIPNKEIIFKNIAALNTIANPVERALEYFAYVCKSQLFWDGNKRVATLVANRVLIESGNGIMIVSHEYFSDFARKLHDYYEDDKKDELKQFLYDNALEGISLNSVEP